MHTRLELEPVSAVATAHAPELVDMNLSHLDAVLAIEAVAYAHPWTRANFVDSLAAGHSARWLRGASGEMLGYMVAMAGPDEMHLLNLTVAPAERRRGHARAMLADLAEQCGQRGAAKLWLEVRPSNAAARALYERLGFAEVGLRKAYYPAGAGGREDALVLCLHLAPTERAEPHALD